MQEELRSYYLYVLYKVDGALPVNPFERSSFSISSNSMVTLTILFSRPESWWMALQVVIVAVLPHSFLYLMLILADVSATSFFRAFRTALHV